VPGGRSWCIDLVLFVCDPIFNASTIRNKISAILAQVFADGLGHLEDIQPVFSAMWSGEPGSVFS
jgi:hypothetical protein